ncbi:hypothetical protein ACFWVC_26970 [Streptomyces sp. NPDC058691]|uniref:hypothetical protein n=1 Tax=Streptomyces sp. NPDC058691 TaxID=3346601 RepID=UPI00365931F0
MTTIAPRQADTPVDQPAEAEIPPVVLLTLRTYRIGVDGKVTDEQPRREITSAQDLPPIGSAWDWPPCQCPTHAPGLHQPV